MADVIESTKVERTNIMNENNIILVLRSKVDGGFYRDTIMRFEQEVAAFSMRNGS